MNAFIDGIRWLLDPENWPGPDGIAARLAEQLWLTVASVFLACLIAIPVGLWLGHIGKGGTLAINISNVGRAIPVDGLQLLRKVELPLAMPLLMNGVRLATVQVVATATIAALVAGPGLGRIITSGFRRQDLPQVIGGAILVALLALVVEGLMELVQRRLDPIRRGIGDGSRQMPDAVDAVTGS